MEALCLIDHQVCGNARVGIAERGWEHGRSVRDEKRGQIDEHFDFLRTLFSNLRYFDPVKHRAGIPEDVAALVEQMTGESLTVTLVNLNQTASREVVVQAGGYGEHQFDSVEWNGQTMPLNAREFQVRLEAGAGGKLALKMRRFVNQPTTVFPWERK